MKKSLSKEKEEIPNGIYDALWSGYSLDILSNYNSNIISTIKTIDGVRGINCRVKVEIVDGDVYIYEL